MSIDVMTLVWKRSQHTGTELLMLLALADWSDDHGSSYPSVSRLAEKCRMTPRNAINLIRALQAGDELEVKVGGGPKGPGGNTNIYRISISTLQGVKPTSGLRSASGVKPSVDRGEAGFREGLKPTSPNTSSIRQETVSIARSSGTSTPVTSEHRPRQPKAEHPLFVEFYAAYPRKVSRKDAAEAFAKLNPDRDHLALMLKAIAAQGLVERCAAGDKQFVPHPATWLRKRRWEDEVDGGVTGGRATVDEAPTWLQGTGFADVFEAGNAGCGAGNAHLFRNRKEISA